MQTEVPYTHLFCARREGAAGLYELMLMRALTACSTKEGRKTDRLIYTSRFVHVIYSSCIVLIRPGTVTPSVVVDFEYTCDRTVQLQRCCPHLSRRCYPHVSWRCYRHLL